MNHPTGANRHMLRTYYTKLVRQALANAFAIGLRSRTEVFRAIVLWSITVLLLYFIGWSRVPIVGTDNPDPASEVRLGLSALGAIVAIFLLSFLWQLIVTPVRWDREMRSRISEIEEALEADADDEVELLRMSEIRKEGLRLYDNITDPTDDEQYHTWRADLERWAEGVKARLREKWSIAALHDFDDAGMAGGWTRRMNNRDVQSLIEGRNEHVLARYTSYFKSLDLLIRSGNSKVLGLRVASLARKKMTVEGRQRDQTD